MPVDSIKRQYIMLKPMVTGANGFARLETQADSALLQLTCKELDHLAKALRVFLYAGEGAVHELGRAPVNPQGQATLTIDLSWRESTLSPSRLQAILIVSDDPAPKPLLLGLCAQQSAGSLMDAKNALLALCEKLSRISGRVSLAEPVAPSSSQPADGPLNEPSNEPLREQQQASASTGTPRYALAITAVDSTPQEVFLSAIDPREHLAKSGGLSSEAPSRQALRPFSPPREELPEPGTNKPAPPSQKSAAPPIDRLRPLVWAPRLREMPSYFDRYPPIAPFDLPGWRFVRVPMKSGASFAIGRYAMDGRVARIAYAVPGESNQPPPRQLARYRFQTGQGGQGYWTLWQEIR